MAHHDHPGWFKTLTLLLGIAGIGAGLALFISGRRDEKSRLLPGGLHKLADGKFYMDEMYLDGFVAGANKASDVCNWTDFKVVDGAVNGAGTSGVFLSDVSGDADQVVVDGAVNLAADVAEGAGAVVSTAQTGRVRNYLTAAIGVTAAAVLVLVFLIG